MLKSILAAAALLAVTSANASVVSFTSKTTFDAAAGVTTKIDFVGLAPDTPVTNQYAALGATFTDTLSITTGFFVTDGFGIYDGNQPTLTINFASLMTSFGVEFPGALIFDLYDNATLVGSSPQYGTSGTGFFGGVVSSVGFNRVVLRDGTDIDGFYDNIYFGKAAVTAVPEPGSLALLGLGLAGLAAIRKRKQA